MEKILISACLVGDKTRFDGKGSYNPLVAQLLEKYELVPFCPEVEGGLRVPRKKSEIVNDKVVSEEGKDVTKNFLEGAQKAYNICLYLGIRTAILKDGSPSCGSSEIHDGKFSNKKIPGMGITAKYLTKKGIRVISDKDIESLLKVEDNTNN